MQGHGLYVWSSFLLTFFICLFLYLRTKKTLKKLEKDFIIEAQKLSQQQLEDFKKHRIVREILVSHSRT